MNLIPMGEYYLWHCDWCDSTNYTLWSSLGEDPIACTACHHHAAPAASASVPRRNPALRTSNYLSPLTIC